MIRRAYYSNHIPDFLRDDPTRILGEMLEHHEFASELLERETWRQEIELLIKILAGWSSGFIAFEYAIPRMGKRADAIILIHGLVFVIEFKVGYKSYAQTDLQQTLNYALDLKYFHKASHSLPIIPILVATSAAYVANKIESYKDLVYAPLRANAANLRQSLETTIHTVTGHSFDSNEWINSEYKPTPTIIEAAQALYRGHKVADISRSEAGATNLTKTTRAILKIIHQSKQNKQKAICFVTGVPGAGKTLAGLNIANTRLEDSNDEHAVFLSGNGPLVKVLREALARDAHQTTKALAKLQRATPFEQNKLLPQKGKLPTKDEELRKASQFIQNIHHFRDEYLTTRSSPDEKVVIFDEAQRAWTLKQTANFMQRKRKQENFQQSESEFLISVMDRHQDWTVIICLIGGGQEINTGEAGLREWFAALGKSFPNWHIYISHQLMDAEYTQGNNLIAAVASHQLTYIRELHLGVSIRSFRSEKVSQLVKAILDFDKAQSRDLYKAIKDDFPIMLTRNLPTAKAWIKQCARGTERYGLLASSGADRLRPKGIDVNSKIEVDKWFLNAHEDVRASYALEQAATEFDIQGLELDWTIVAWDADLRFSAGTWEYKNFSGTTWQAVNDEQRQIYLKNAYRVLLTRARQGMVIFVPEGDDEDITRKKEFYDGTFEYLKSLGLQLIH